MPKPRIELRDGWYHLDGRKVLLNALGYESGARPGEDPYAHAGRDLDQVRRDLKLIRAAGFNGIRTWSEMSESELKVVQASGLKIVFGINLPVDEDFSDPRVVARDLDRIRRVLAYSRKYSCVITYLIMNEPKPEHFRKVGAQATRDLWQKAVALIHELHPGVPVTMDGNVQITEWVDMNLFDVYGRNAYDYHDGANYTHGFANAQRAITETLGQGRPVLLTEFGRSVSRKGGQRYGGNTLEEQAAAMVQYYRDILDSGATGLCPFYYADGWWKAGNPAVHDDEPEEWFGFLGFKDVKDTAGLPRPAWHALSRYNRALVASPKNHQFYLNRVPIEVFCQPDVRTFRMIHQDRVVYEGRPERGGYLSGSLEFKGEGLRDRELVCEAYDARGRLLKVETLIVLTGDRPVPWPTLELKASPEDLEGARKIQVDVALRNLSEFSLGTEVRYSFAYHKGWDRPEDRSRTIDPRLHQQGFSDVCEVPEGCPMLALYAGADISFGKFRTTIYAHRYLYPGHWADSLRIQE